MSRCLLAAAGRTLRILPAVFALAALPSPAMAIPGVTLQAKLQPERLGASTTVSIGFRIAAGGGREPSPLSAFAVRLPAGMGFAATTLGLETCSVQTLLTDGPRACPHESTMGFGSAQVRAPFGSQTVLESAHVSIFMAQPASDHTTMLFYFDGRKPVIAPLVLESEVLPSLSSSVLATTIPPIPTTPDASDVAIVALQANIGPGGLRYFKHEHHRIVAYRPQGLNVPETCPKGGFVFTSRFSFQDGSHTSAKSVVPCPPGAVRHRKHVESPK